MHSGHLTVKFATKALARFWHLILPPRYLVLGWNGGQMSPVAVMSDVSGGPGSVLVRRRRRRAVSALHLLQAVREETGGKLRCTLVLVELPGLLHAVTEGVRGRVRLLPTPRTVHEQRRGDLLRQVRVLQRGGGGRGPGHGAPQGVALTYAQDTGKCRQGKITGPHAGELGERPPSSIHGLVYILTWASFKVTRDDATARRSTATPAGGPREWPKWRPQPNPSELTSRLRTLHLRGWSSVVDWPFVEQMRSCYSRKSTGASNNAARLYKSTV